MNIDVYWQQMRARICHRCVDGDGTGACRLPGGEVSCSLKQFLPEIITAVVNTHSNDIDVYINSLRKDVCTHCDWQKPDATCQKRTDLECALDRYYPLVLEIIESTQENIRTIQGSR